MQMYNLETDKITHECEYDGNEVTWKWFKKFKAPFEKKLVAPEHNDWLPFDRLKNN